LIGFYAAAILLLAGAGYAAGLDWPYYPFLFAAAAQAGWQVRTFNANDPTDCLMKFQQTSERLT